MRRDEVYFTWPDRTFSYRCQGCGACCKGLGIGLDSAADQPRQMVDNYPESIVFLRKRGLAWTAFNPRGRCWYLDEAGLCRIETDHGRSAKPASCRLFPFNRIFSIGDYTIVDYNSVVCPLTAAGSEGDAAAAPDPGPDREPGSSGPVGHDDVLAEIAGIADPAVVGTRIPVERAVAASFVTRERAIAGACFSAATRDPPDLAAVWRAQLGDGSQAGARTGRAGSVSFEQATAALSASLEFLAGQPWTAPSGSSLQNALWLTPSLRFNELFGPRDYDPLAEREKLLPDLWLVWLHGVAAGSKLAGRDLTMQEATSLWSEFMPLAHVVARWSHAPTAEPGPVELPGEADPDRVIERLARACLDNRKARRPLSALLGPLLEPHDHADRVVLARMMEPLLRPIRWRRQRT